MTDKFTTSGEAGRALIAAHLIEGGPGDPDTLELAATLCNFAPAMLAALHKAQELLRELEAPAHLDEGEALDDEIAAIIARIDGTPTDEADDCGAGAAANLSRGALIEAVGEALALAGPTAQPDLAEALADLFERGSWHDDGSFVYWPDDSEPENEGAIFTLSNIHNRHTS